MNFNELPRAGRRNRVHDIESHQRRYTGLWVGIGSAVLGAAGTVYSSQQAKKLQNRALDSARGITADIDYQPIDIEKLKLDAQNQAIANATASLAIERALSPDVSMTREELARQVRADLERGGNLPTDVQNQVTQSARVIGNRSGGGSGVTTPLTASLIGLNAYGLLVESAPDLEADANQFLQLNDLPVAGLDPGTLASLEVADNAANNQFNLEKAGVSSNLANSEAAARASQIGSTAGLISSIGNELGKVGKTYADVQKQTEAEKLKAKTKPQPATFNYSFPSTPLGLTG